MSFDNMGNYLGKTGMRVWLSAVALGLMVFFDLIQMMNACVFMPKDDDSFESAK